MHAAFRVTCKRGKKEREREPSKMEAANSLAHPLQENREETNETAATHTELLEMVKWRK